MEIKTVATKPKIIIYGPQETVTNEVSMHIESLLEEVEIEVRRTLQVREAGVFEQVPELTFLVVLTGHLVRHKQMAEIRRFYREKKIALELCEGASQRDFDILRRNIAGYEERVRTAIAAYNAPVRSAKEKTDYNWLGEFFDLSVIASFESTQAWIAFAAVANSPRMPARSEQALLQVYRLRGEDPSEWPDGVGALSIGFIRKYLIQKGLLKN